MRLVLAACGLLIVSFAAIAAGDVYRVVERPPLVAHREFTIAEIVIQESMRAGISAHLPLAVAWRESRLTDVVSATSDFGALQVNALTAMRAGIDPTALTDPRIAIVVGVNWLAHWQHVCGSDRAAVAAYATGRCK